MKILSITKVLNEATALQTANAMDTARSNSEYGLKQLGINPNAAMDSEKKKGATRRISIEFFFKTGGTVTTQTSSEMNDLKLMVKREQVGRDTVLTLYDSVNSIILILPNIREDVDLKQTIGTVYPCKVKGIKGAFTVTPVAGGNINKIDRSVAALIDSIKFLNIITVSSAGI
jgi:hypothetical protein